MTISGLVLAAGQSSRMGAFKPFLRLNGFSMLEMAIGSLKNAGVSKLCVVAGREAESVARESEKLGVRCVVNAAFETTDMLTSVKLGLRALAPFDAVFVLPVDVPLALPSTLDMLLREFKQSNNLVVCPHYGGVRAHPPLISGQCTDAILQYNGELGLRGSLDLFAERTCLIYTDDVGSSLDADTADEFETLEKLARAQTGISDRLCNSLQDEFDLLPNIRAHTGAVATVADMMAKTLVDCGNPLDLALIHSGARLHDLCRLEHHHSHYAAAILRERGYCALADVVERHDSPAFPDPSGPREAYIVYLADKLVQEDSFVTIEHRFARAITKFESHPEVLSFILNAIDKANRIMRQYEDITNENLYEQCRNLLS
ncbi:MAG: nucleotidyltransferase family protein [Oscillospiraceae bacterium]